MHTEIGLSAPGTNTTWTTIFTHVAGSGSFSGTLTLDMGWYDLTIRSKLAGNTVSITEVFRVGVGDIFVIAGQSLAANNAEVASFPVSNTWASSLQLGGNYWRFAHDPQPTATGTGGSIWPAFADDFIGVYNVPVGFLNVSVGGTEMSQWVPGGTYYPQLQQAVQKFPVNGFRSIIWILGETDAAINTPQADFTAGLHAAIDQTRIDAGWSIPWGIDKATWQSSVTSATIQAALMDVADNYIDCYRGADSDSLDNSYRSDTTHMNASGQIAHAHLWRVAIGTKFGF